MRPVSIRGWSFSLRFLSGWSTDGRNPDQTDSPGDGGECPRTRFRDYRPNEREPKVSNIKFPAFISFLRTDVAGSRVRPGELITAASSCAFVDCSKPIASPLLKQ